MKTLVELFHENPYHNTTKFIHNLMIYDELFAKYRNIEVFVLEIGILEGGSLELWKTYFGQKAHIYGIDVDITKAHYLNNESQITMIQGSQGDREFLRSIKQIIPKIDILIDDGSHVSEHQIATFEELFSYIDENGIYACEDMHNCWHPNNIQYNFAHYLKKLTDSILGSHESNSDILDTIGHSLTIKSINFSNNMIVIEKKNMKSHVRSPIRTGKL